MAKFIDSLESWCYNIIPESPNTSPPWDDFLPRYYQTELVSSMNSGKVLFLPTEQDKLHVLLLLVKRFSVELGGKNRYIVYLADSIERANRVAAFLKKHVNFEVTLVERLHNVDIHQISFLIYVHHSWNSENLLENTISNALFVILDDCAFGLMRDHPLKEVTESLFGSTHCQNFNIIGLTSILIHHDEQIRWSLTENMYSYFVQMEKKLKSTITSSIHCNAVKKYLTTIKHKLVKYAPVEERLCENEISTINRSLKFMYTLMNKLKYRSDEHIIVKDRLQSILQDFKKMFFSYGLFPSFIVACLSRIALEKLKLLCSDDSSFIAVATIISEFDIISSLFQRCMEHDSTIESYCDAKIMKAWSIISSIDPRKKGVIFVNDTITAQMITHVFQKLSSPSQDENSISIESIVSDTSELVFGTTCEELYKKKNIRKTLKSFLNGSIRVLIVPWNILLNTSVVHADWIFYFDLPPNYTSYIISQKYGNCIDNELYFMVQLTAQDPKSRIEPFADLNLVLKEVLRKKHVTNLDDLKKSFRSDEMTVKRLKKPSVSSIFEEADLHSAIDVVNKYCNSLPTDAFTRMAPTWTMEKKDNDVICKLQLPLEPSVRFVIETKPLKDLVMTKRVASLKMIKKLKELRHLDDEMVSQINEVDPDLWCENSLFPLWRHEDDDDYEIGTTKRRVVPIKFPEWLYDCAPQSGVDCYVHIIHMNPVYEMPTSSRKKFFHTLLKSQEEFGIVTRKKLPDICQFPVFTDLGQVDISVKMNVSVQRFTDEQVEKLFSFHKFVFLDVLQVVKGFQIADRSNKENSYFVVPLFVNSNSTLEIAWDVVDSAFMNEVIMPSDDERIHTDYISKDYVGKIVSPWYRILPQRNYVVTKVLKDSSPSCPFTSDEYQSFTTYYSDKYELEVKQPIQPLLEARAVTMNLNCVRPRARTPGIRRKRGERETDFDEILIPEFCVIQPFPAVYWYKSVTLPAIAHRLHYIMLAETIRQLVASSGQNSPLRSWPSDDNDVLKVEVDCNSEDEESLKMVTPIASVLKDIKLAKRNRSFPWADEQPPVDVDRNSKKTCVLELMMQHNFFKKLDTFVDEYSYSAKKNCFLANHPSEAKFLPRFLELDCELSPGPKQSDIYQALTLVKCGDIVNLKFFKIIGRAFLKFASSLLLYRVYNNLNEVQLKRLRGKLIGKRNLFYCGSKLNLGSCLKLHDVTSDYDWNFGGFGIPQQLVDVITESGISQEVIFNLVIPCSDQSSGVLSAETRNSLHEKTLNYYNETTKEDTNFLSPKTSSFHDNNDHVLIYFKKQCVPDNAVVDVLKALTGAYLMNCGVKASFEFLQFMHILKRDISLQTLFTSNPRKPNRKEGDVDVIEDLHNRIFIKRDYESNPLFAQIFTHHSCYPESSSECNRKLAFLGNALLDFLITGYIFECRDPQMTIDDLEDVRVALVNDVLFAILSVRIGLHKILLLQSPLLAEKIDKFVMQQERVNHKINHNEYLFLIEETSDLDAETIDAPKVLSDTFKALIAAVFLDTGDLKDTWNICYNLMKPEIDTFMHDAPRNPLKLLYETKLLDGHPEKLPPPRPDYIFQAVQLNIKIDDMSRRYIGVGEDKQQAKIIAAKLALRDLSKNFTL